MARQVCTFTLSPAINEADIVAAAMAPGVSSATLRVNIPASRLS